MDNLHGQIMEYVESQTLYVGDRVRIRRDKWPLIGKIDQTGVVVKILRMPRHSCLVQVDGDPVIGREWFFYRAEVEIDSW